MNDIEMVEKVAKEMAIGNNGGTWAEHYTEEQKEVWRGRAVRVISDCYDMIKKNVLPTPNSAD